MKNAFLISINTLRETLRQKLILIVALIALALVLSSKYLLSLDLGHEQLRFVFDFGSGALGFFDSIIAVVATAQIFHNEIENKTIITLFSKPVGSTQFVFGKFGGAVFALAIFAFVVALATSLMLAITSLGIRNAEDVASINYIGVFAFAFIQWIKLCAICAISAFICSASTSLLFSVIVSFMVLAVSMAGDITLRLGGKQEGFTELVSWIFPDFHVFNVAENFAFAPINIGDFFASAGYGIIYCVCALIASAIMFSKREF
ncbi:MAG: ABC transporter permease subunit [Opitutales bacterium]|nr:ABC transporter permease subunit [Opitutales bacterium]